MLSLGEMVKLNAERVPGDVAIIWRDIRINHRQLHQRTNALAHALITLKVSKGDRVALYSRNCHQFIEAYIACSKIGAIVVPLNAMLSPREINRLINHCKAKLLIYSADLTDSVNGIKSDIPLVKEFITIGRDNNAQDYENLVSTSPTTDPGIVVAAEDIATISYTSGTTGLPKGVMLSNSNLFSNAVNAITCCHIPLGGVEVVPFPLFFTAIFNSHVFPYLLAEGGVIVMDRFKPEALIDTINREHPTYTTLNPTMLNDFITHPDFKNCDLSSLQGILVAASPLSLSRMQQAWAALGKILVQGYGLTESTSFTTCTRAQDYIETDPEKLGKRLTSVGRAVPTLEVDIFDEAGNTLPHDTEAIGEIVVRGPSVMAGYWQQPEATAAAIKNNWLYTGDLGTMDADGYVWMVGRKKDMIISGGINIYPEDVESALDTMKQVKEAAVVGRPDERWGEAVTAIIVPKDGACITSEEVIAHCREWIASYKKPTKVIFVEKLPRNASGKVKKDILREQLAKGEL